MGIGKEINDLMRDIGYDFKDITFLETALTHSSYTNEMKQKGFRAESNEALEFLGDAVLEIVISEYLYERYSKKGEGTLSRLRQTIVCESTLSKIAVRLSLGDYLNVGTAEECQGLRKRNKILADALEALIAAIYLDDRTNANGIVYRSVVIRLFEKEIENILKNGNRDYKTLLQQFVEKNGDAQLRYDIEENGPEHEKTFIATAYINNNKVGDGKGSTKRTAEMQAAKVALRLFGII
jgi:ribonuclease-3